LVLLDRALLERPSGERAVCVRYALNLGANRSGEQKAGVPAMPRTVVLIFITALFTTAVSAAAQTANPSSAQPAPIAPATADLRDAITPLGMSSMTGSQVIKTISDDPEHPWTVSVQVGPDNSFSGKMIKPGSGTLSGVPVVFFETKYDDVYGRNALWKFTVGRRYSARSEFTGSFVLSRSSSEPVVVGSIGTANVPVTVLFDDYSYWGFEAGQRFFFTRVRFTPFAGYYVGINRIDKINALVTAPAAVGNQSSLVLTDAQFYDSSWAFSFGPTGGVLVGLGPVEAMVQVEIRYIGGLSDIDPLSEANLRDINSESSRWSFPILFGARIRF
jgi:hypothetical protein